MAATITPIRGATPTLTWLHNDPAGFAQATYRVQIIAVGGAFPATGTLIVDTGVVTSASQGYVVGAGSLALGSIYKWQVTTTNTSGWASRRKQFRDDGTDYLQTYSDPSYFRCVTPPTVTGMTTGTVTTPTPAVSWTYTGSTAQTYYQVTASTASGTSVYVGASVVSAAVAFTFPIDVFNSGGASVTYYYTVTVWDSDLIYGSGTASVIVSYAYPTVASAIASVRNDLGYITIGSIAGGSTAAFWRIYRRVTGCTTFTLLKDTLATTYYNDISVAAGETYDYALATVDASNRESAKYTTGLSSLRPAFPGTWLMSPDDATLDTHLINYSPPERADSIDQAIIQPLDRDATVVELGAVRTRRGALKGILPNDGSSSSTPTALLRNLVTMRNNKLPVWIKGSNAESALYAVLLNVSVSDRMQTGERGERGYVVSLDFAEVEAA